MRTHEKRRVSHQTTTIEGLDVVDAVARNTAHVTFRCTMSFQSDQEFDTHAYTFRVKHVLSIILGKIGKLAVSLTAIRDNTVVYVSCPCSCCPFFDRSLCIVNQILMNDLGCLVFWLGFKNVLSFPPMIHRRR